MMNQLINQTINMDQLIIIEINDESVIKLLHN